MFIVRNLRYLQNIALVRRCCNKAKEPYVQGQSPSPGIREYFFYVDHNGMLFQDDSKMKHWTAAMKEKKLLDTAFVYRGKVHKDSHFLLAVFTENNNSRRSPKAIVCRAGTSYVQ